jgi:NitT/TauT family transport system substrate-binding protein
MRTFWAAAALVFLGGCGSSSPGRSTVRLAVGGAGQIVYLPVTLARELGYYDQEGLNVEFQDYPGGAKALQSLMAGSADVVSGFYDHTIQMAAEGKPLRSFVVMLRYPGLALVVSPAASKRIAAVKDLSGATVGVTAPGSSTDLFLSYLLQRHGVPAQQVSVTGIGHNASAVAAMERGTVDAAVMTDPAISAIVRRAGPVRILADTRTEQGTRDELGAGMYPASVLYATPGWLAGHASEAKALARALQRTLAWMREHDAATIAGRLPAAMRGDDPALFTAALAASLGIFSPNGAMPDDGPSAVRRVLELSLPKVRATPVDLKATYTNEYLTSGATP